MPLCSPAVPPRRRQALLALAGLALLQAGCAGGPGGRGAVAGSPPANAGPPSAEPGAALQPQRLAEGVYLLQGSGGVADEHNGGRIGNAGFIVGPAGVLAIDTGTSLAHGRALLAAIRRTTALPVKAALVSHTRPEFLFGGNAFRELGIPIHMQRRTAQLMAARCATCLKALLQQVGEAAMAGTTMYVPDVVHDDTPVLPDIGRPLRVIYPGHSSGPGDIAVLDPSSGVLFGGGLLDAGRIPDIQDSDLPGWQRALDALAALQPRTVVPGHGPAGGPALITTVARYLVALQARARELVAEGASLINVAETTELPEFTNWDQYDTIHRRNASIAFLRFERELLLK